MRRFVALALSSTLVLQVAPLMAAPAAPGARAGRAQAPVATGALNGTAHSASGQTLSNYTVQLRNLQTGQVAGTSTSNAAGSFSFTGLNPATYMVEVLNPAGVIVGSSAATAVAAGATVTVTVSTMAAALAGVAAGGAAAAGVSTALVVTTVAVAAGIAGAVVVARNNASPSR